jgi:ABC-2 type transport system permease protein
MSINWIGIATLYKRETWRFLKVWNQTLVAPVITTLIFLAVLTLAMGSNSARMIHEVPFIQFIAPGLIMMAMVQNSFANTSSSFMIAKLQGVIIDWLTPPFSAGELVAGFTAGGITRGVLVGVTVSFAMAIFTHIGMHSWLLAITFAVLSCMMLALLGVIAGVYGNTPDQVSAITNFIITPLSFLSGTFYSIHDLPPFFRDISHLNPFFYMIDGFRFALIGTSDADPATGLLVLVGTNLVLIAVAHCMFATGWRLKS